MRIESIHLCSVLLLGLVACADGGMTSGPSGSAGAAGTGTPASGAAGAAATGEAGAGQAGSAGGGASGQAGAEAPSGPAGAAGADAGADAMDGPAAAADATSDAAASDAGAKDAGPAPDAAAPSPGKDVFGITMLRPSRVPALEWTSRHWATGALRSVTGRDPSDPTGWSIRRGDTNLMEIDGAGVMSMGGAQARFYVQPTTDKGTTPFFRDVEFTGYYRRVSNDGASNAGFLVGIRAHVNGHGDVDHCLASTYYLVFRNSGTWTFDKELDHPADSPGVGGRLIPGGGPIPIGKWIGMKFVAYNLPGDKAVKLEAYADLDGDGDTSQGGSWKKVGETVDDGSWSAPTGSCGIPGNTVVTEGGGVVFIRNTAVAKVQYTKLSWREIAR
jgi:hypothetical protein